MADLEFFDRHGIYTVRGFFDAETCARLRAGCGGRTPAAVTRADGHTGIDERARRTLNAAPDDSAVAVVLDRLHAEAPRVAQRFGVTLHGFQVPHFLHYRRGDYFRAHRDNADDPRQPETIRARKIAVVVFLNGESVTPMEGRYRGGELVFYRLGPGPTEDQLRAVLHGEEGLLLAFRTDVFHEVLPVTHGDRFTIVTWYE